MGWGEKGRGGGWSRERLVGKKEKEDGERIIERKKDESVCVHD